MEKVRYDYIDIARGFAMLFVVWWHICNIHTEWSDGWVMPLFFVIMGVFYRQQSSFKELIIKKINTLVIPCLFCSIPALLICLLKNGINNTLVVLCNPYKNIHGVSWFLVCMFECYVLYWILNKKTEGRVVLRIVFSFLFSSVGFFTSQMHVMGYRFVLPFFLSTAFTCIGFIESGRLLSQYVLKLSMGG